MYLMKHWQQIRTLNISVPNITAETFLFSSILHQENRMNTKIENYIGMCRNNNEDYLTGLRRHCTTNLTQRM